QRLRLLDAEPSAGRGLRHGARRELEAPTRGAVRLREHERHVMAGGAQRLERGDREGWRARVDDAHGRARGQAALRWRFLSLVRMRFCFRSERSSTKILPSRWSISCWMQVARSPEAFRVKREPLRSRAVTVTL